MNEIALRVNDVIIFLDGNKQNFEADNLLRLTRSELARYCKDHLYSSIQDISRAAAQIAKIKEKMGEIKNEAKTGK